MLIQLSIANFRSILATQTLSLVAGPGSEHAVRNLITGEHEGLRLLRSAVIYGPNAAGKSNVLRALAALRQLVEQTATRVQEGQRLSVIVPFMLDTDAARKPSELEIIFIADDGVRYHYALAVSPERVHREWLVAYPNARPQRWFERVYDEKKRHYDWWFGPSFQGERAERKVWREFTRANALFLSTAVQLNNDQLKPAFAWITQKLLVLIPGFAWNPSLSLALLKDDAGKEQLMRYMRAADIDIDRLELLEEDPPGLGAAATPAGFELGSASGLDGVAAKRVQVRAWHKQSGSDQDVALDIQEESAGTRQLFELAGTWVRALQSGAILFVDELDRSLHPLMSRFLVGRFQGSANRRDAQLVYTTHDTSLLDSDLLRRDQVWFVEKDENRSTRLYSLLEYRPRKEEALERGYLKGRYGALPLISDVRA